MSHLGFSSQWINLIMSCVRSVRYQVLINGKAYGDIQPSRGLRQGDPLSPYLFVLCTEILARMLQRAEEEGKITCLKVARSAPSVSHLLFADDSLFYYKQEAQELDFLNGLLKEYSLASGQRINYQKSSIYFGKQIPLTRKEEIKQQLGINEEGGKGVYLGLPETFGGSKVSILGFLKDKLSQKISGWQNNFLSQVARKYY